MRKTLYILIGLMIIFASCEKEDNIMINTHGSVRVDIDITSIDVNTYSSLESNITINYEIENLGYWNVDYYEILFCVQYIDSEGVTHQIHDVSNGSDIVGHSTAYNNKFMSLDGIFLEAYVENYSIYN